MKSLATLFLAAGLILLQGETFEDASIKVKVESPKDFSKLDVPGSENEFIGQIKALYTAHDVADSRGTFLIHHMSLPALFTDYAALKSGLSAGLEGYLGEHYKKVKQEDVKADGKEGFFLEYQCKGGENGPDPNGTIPLQVRWYIIKDGDKYLGLIYAAHQDKWKDFEPLFVESFKSAKLSKE